MSQSEGLEVIIWNLDTLDWKRPAPDAIVAKVMKMIKPGSIILCHDIHPGTIAAVPVFVKALQEQGYSFVTVSKLIGLKQSTGRRYLRG